MISGIANIVTSVAVMQLIGFLSFPYNVILFFIYYKFFTALILCVIPLGFSLAAVLLGIAFRRELIEDGNAEIREYIEQTDSADSGADQLVREHKRTESDDRLRGYRQFERQPIRVNSRSTFYQAV